ncbi:N-acetyltransferase [Salmonella enterica]|nr:N-acetyltransferase [Salmonella enterica]ECC9415182.1 N-acetyltransferase [Salmonella enterica subsp. enterica]EHF1448743.1 N-acetyltransferase [Salmonella enterica subsp. enterica serovar 4,5,12:b:-]EHG1528820.1 N-acetyltransferase [Salmonella enterica subsp. enterica serovar 4,[5],12:b:-]ECD8848869.1 N-acetyltransferase [Salmonella enterica subsp. enterica]
MRFKDCVVRDVVSGENVQIVRPANIYECELRDNVFIGPFVEIQKGGVIGCGTRIQSHTFICENVTLDQNCFIGHNVTFANDLFHSGATVLSPYICSGSVVGAGSVVAKPIEVKGIYAGNPARLIREL